MIRTSPLAYNYLAICYDHLGEEEKAALYQSRAYELRDRVSEREKLLITSGYYWIVAGDLDKERETDQLWSTEYPRDYLPWQDLGEIYSMYLGQYEKAAELYKQGWQLEPKQPNSPRSLAYCYLALNRTQEARELLDRALENTYDGWSVHAARYAAAAMQGDNPTLESERRWSAAQPATTNIADAIWAEAVQRGQMKEARKIADRQTEEMRAAGYNEACVLVGSRVRRRGSAVRGLRRGTETCRAQQTLFRSRANLETVAFATALSGDTRQAQKIIDELKSKHPSDTVLQQVMVPLVNAANDISQDHPEKAIVALSLRNAMKQGAYYGPSIVYLRGLAHLKNHQQTDAIADFQGIIDHRGISPLAQQWVLAHLGLARAQASSGEIAKASILISELFQALGGRGP